jgi:glycosyltransferase involved in cell wall biosynthesis
MSESCVVIVLTFNSSAVIGETLAQAGKVSDDIHVVDSFSSDGTCNLARAAGCRVSQRAFLNYADQRNWAIAQSDRPAAWQLHLDADEVLDDEAVASIRKVLDQGAAAPHDAYLIRRVDHFMGRRLRFSGLNPWHLRLFRTGLGQCEDRLYDQHFVATVTAGRLRGSMLDRNAGSLSEWTARHNRWSDLEAAELAADADSTRAGRRLRADLGGDPRERTRALKGAYYRLPPIWRALAYFAYRYVLRLGFLDGRAGFYFAALQALWFRLLVDAKLHEAQQVAFRPGEKVG